VAIVRTLLLLAMLSIKPRVARAHTFMALAVVRAIKGAELMIAVFSLPPRHTRTLHTVLAAAMTRALVRTHSRAAVIAKPPRLALAHAVHTQPVS